MRLGLLGLILVLGICAPLAQAAEHNVALPFETKAKQAVMIDVSSNTILLEKNAHERMPTSSMSKMLTAYLVFDALKQGKLKLDDMVGISKAAWQIEGSRMFAQVGSQVRVEDLIRGVIIQSGNDASVALAEAVAGTEEGFVRRMNETAAKLGMTNSHFANANGLPRPDHYSTAYDLALLGMALYRDFPEYYHYFGEKEFTFNKIKQGNRNPLLYRNMGVDGIKTGHAEAAGYALAAMAERQGRRIILIVNGLANMQERADEPARLLEYGYHEFNRFVLLKAGESAGSAKLWLGTAPDVTLAPAQDVAKTLPVAARAGMKVAVEYQEPVSAPVTKGQVLGKLVITAPQIVPIEVPLQAQSDVPEQGFFAALFTKLGYLLRGKAA